MDDLIAFLRARLDTQERHALAAGKSDAARHWSAGLDHVDDGEHETVVRLIDEDEPLDADRAVFIAYHDPAHVLAEVAAKRQMIDMCEGAIAASKLIGAGADDALAETIARSAEAMAIPTLHLLALPYASHPDYREEWRP